jgi:hypothetical protein
MKEKLLVTVLLIVLCTASGMAGAWYFNRYHGNEHRIFTVDVKAIVAQKKKELLDRYRKIPQEETAAGIEKELGEFLKVLDGKLTAYDTDGSVLIVKDAVLAGEAIDITKEISTQVGVDVTEP